MITRSQSCDYCVGVVVVFVVVVRCFYLQFTLLGSTKVCRPKTNAILQTNTMYYMHTLGASKCMHVVHSVGFRFALVLGRHTLNIPLQVK